MIVVDSKLPFNEIPYLNSHFISVILYQLRNLKPFFSQKQNIYQENNEKDISVNGTVIRVFIRAFHFHKQTDY